MEPLWIASQQNRGTATVTTPRFRLVLRHDVILYALQLQKKPGFYLDVDLIAKNDSQMVCRRFQALKRHRLVVSVVFIALNRHPAVVFTEWLSKNDSGCRFHAAVDLT